MGFFGGFLSGVNKVAQKHLQDQRDNDNKQKDAQAQVIFDGVTAGIAHGKDPASAIKYGQDELGKIYGKSKEGKGLIDKLSGLWGKAAQHKQGGGGAPGGNTGMPPPPPSAQASQSQGQPTAQVQASPDGQAKAPAPGGLTPPPSASASASPQGPPQGDSGPAKPLSPPPSTSAPGANPFGLMSQDEKDTRGLKNKQAESDIDTESKIKVAKATAEARGDKVLKSWTGDDGKMHMMVQRPDGGEPVEEIHGGVKPTGPQVSSPEEVAAMGKTAVSGGLSVVPAKDRPAVMKYMVDNGLSPKPKDDNSPEGRLSRALRDSDSSLSEEDARKQAGSTIAKAEEAKSKIASEGEAATISPSQMMALAWSDAIRGVTRPWGLGRSPNRDLYNLSYARIAAGESPYGDTSDLLSKRSDLKSLQSSLNNLQKMQTTVNSAEDTFKTNLGYAVDLSNKVDRTDSSFLNEYALAAEGKLTDAPNLSAFGTAVNTAANEYAKIVTSNTGGGAATSDAARKEAALNLYTAQAKGAFQASADQMIKDATARKDALSKNVEGLRDSIQQIGKPKNKGIPNPPPSVSGGVRPPADRDPMQLGL